MPQKRDLLDGKIFDLRKMVKMLQRHPKLLYDYKRMNSKYKDALGYHYNEILLAILFIFKVMKDETMMKQYNSIVTLDTDPTKIMSEMESYISEKCDENVDAKELINEVGKFLMDDEETIDETTTAASSGSYSTPFIWTKDGKPNNDNRAFRDGQKVTVKKDRHVSDPKNIKLGEDWKKTNSVQNKERIGNETEKLTKKDLKTKANFKDVFDDPEKMDAFYKLDFDSDSMKPEDIKADRNSKEEDEKIRMERGDGMQDFHLDFPDEQYEDRLRDDIGEDLYQTAKDKEAYNKEQKHKGYPKTAQPVELSEMEQKVKDFVENDILKEYIDFDSFNKFLKC